MVRGRVFNVGGGPSNSVSLRELISLIRELTGTDVAYSFADWRPGDQPWYVTDTRALSAALGWKSSMPLREGLISLHAWLARRFCNPSKREAFA
jgi:CDP-paratose 2-epimerase